MTPKDVERASEELAFLKKLEHFIRFGETRSIDHGQLSLIVERCDGEGASLDLPKYPLLELAKQLRAKCVKQLQELGVQIT